MGDFWAQFTVKTCEACGLEHAPVRTCEEALEFHEFNNRDKDTK